MRLIDSVGRSLWGDASMLGADGPFGVCRAV